MPIVLLLMGLLSVSLWFLGYAADLEWLRMAAKAWPVLCLVPWVPQKYIRAALLFGALGDVLLMFPNLFIAGLGAFLVGHGFYIYQLVQTSRTHAQVHTHTKNNQIYHWALLGPSLVFAVMLLAILAPHLGDLLAPVGVYGLTLSVLIWRSSIIALQGYTQTQIPTQTNNLPAGLALLCGSVLFATSDAFIAINRFLAPFMGASIAIMLTYWAAQFLLGYGFWLLGKSAARSAS